MEGSLHHEDLLRSRFVLFDRLSSDDSEGATGRQDFVRRLLRLFGRHCIEYVRQRGIRDGTDLFFERRRGKSSIENVRCTQVKKEVLVFQRRCRDDGVEARHLGELDRCTP